MKDNVRECDRGTSGEYAQPQPCACLGKESAIRMGSRNNRETPFTKGVLVLELGTHYTLAKKLSGCGWIEGLELQRRDSTDVRVAYNTRRTR